MAFDVTGQVSLPHEIAVGKCYVMVIYRKSVEILLVGCIAPEVDCACCLYLHINIMCCFFVGYSMKLRPVG